jgi:hypothetical protein
MNRREFAYVAALGSAASAGTRAAAGTQTGRIPEVAGLIAEMVSGRLRPRRHVIPTSLSAKTALAGYGDHIHDGALSPAGSVQYRPQFADAGRLAS